MNDNETLLDALVEALDAASTHSPAETEKAAVLWPDETRQWERIVNRVRETRPVLTLGPYEPGTWTGPAYWVRCVVDGAIPRPAVPGVPIVYLPAIARSDIRAVEDASAELKPLAELQYRGDIFAQLSDRDWTTYAFLTASEARGGLGIATASDDGTKDAIRGALEALADERIGSLRQHAPLKAAFFNGLLTPDIDRDVLRWLDDPVSFEVRRSKPEMDAFRDAFHDRFGLDLNAGEIEVARRLGTQPNDAWKLVWTAYEDAPTKYPNVESRLRAARPKQTKERLGFFDARGVWPQENEEGEASLRAALKEVGVLGGEAAGTRLIELDHIHGERRDWVWAALGRAPLAAATEWLAALARATRRMLPAASLSKLVEAYVSDGWIADNALMRCLATAEEVDDLHVVAGAAAAAYRPWLEVAAERMQAAISSGTDIYPSEPLPPWPKGTAVVFVDGLRFDVGHRLADALTAVGIQVEVQAHLTALPSITSTAKPAVSPAASRLVGGDALGPVVEGGPKFLSADGLRNEITSAGYEVLGQGETGSGTGRAWTEAGDIDALGHEHEGRLPALLDDEVRRLVGRIRQLLEAGWSQVAVVTDHGWLFLPGGLPKAELAINLAKDALRKGRAARLEPGVAVEVPTVPWYWDPSVRIAVAPGIRSFQGSPVYEHGGISPEECVTPIVVARKIGQAPTTDIDLAVLWSGLWARVTVDGAPGGTLVDLRRAAGDPGSSCTSRGPAAVEDGKASLLVDDEDLEGVAAELVVVNPAGLLLAQRTVTIGGDE